MSERPLVAVPCDVKGVGIHPFHAVGEKYVNAVFNGSGCLPVLLPALAPGTDLQAAGDLPTPEALLARFDGLFLPGSTSNVDPSIYQSDLAFDERLLDPQRDTMTLALIRAAVAENVPLLAICRGIQEVNVAFGGSLHQHVHTVDGLQDHREDATLSRAEQYAPVHGVTLVDGGVLHKLAGRRDVEVNSLHGQGVHRLGEGLLVEATALDGLIEALRVDADVDFAIGVQWHAEWRYWEDPLSRALFTAFGDAVRARAKRRQ